MLSDERLLNSLKPRYIIINYLHAENKQHPYLGKIHARLERLHFQFQQGFLVAWGAFQIIGENTLLQ
jgi:hypothetical protein